MTVPAVTAAVATAAVARAPATTAPATATVTTLVDAFGVTSANSVTVELFVFLTAREFATGKKRNSEGLAFYRVNVPETPPTRRVTFSK